MLAIGAHAAAAAAQPWRWSLRPTETFADVRMGTYMRSLPFRKPRSLPDVLREPRRRPLREGATPSQYGTSRGCRGSRDNALTVATCYWTKRGSQRLASPMRSIRSSESSKRPSSRHTQTRTPGSGGFWVGRSGCTGKRDIRWSAGRSHSLWRPWFRPSAHGGSVGSWSNV